MDPTAGQRTHSAIVEMDLILPDRVLEIAQLAPDFFILTIPTDHPPCDAEIILRVDGHETRSRVRLAEGISTTARHTRILPRK